MQLMDTDSMDTFSGKKVDTPTVFNDPAKASLYVAEQMATLIRTRQTQGEKVVLGLATGKTPILVYDELVRLHRNEGLSFANVITFNLDEYYPIVPQNEQSYHYFMHKHLFQHVDIDPNHIHIPNTDCGEKGILKYCKAYEETIVRHGGIDLQLLGIGRNGHIGFNEPGTPFEATTRLVHLHPWTRKDAESDFGSLSKVPEKAISIGIHTIIQAKRILLLALGERKSEIVHRAFTGEITMEVPASILQTHAHAEVVLDQEAAALMQNS